MASSSPHSSNPHPKRVVVKLGTGVLTSGIGELNTARIAAVCAEIAALRARGTEVIVVSSGAVGLGMGRLRLAKKPKETSKKQACAAVGQSLLMQTWQAGFAPHGLTVAQVLLTHDDLRLRSRYLGVQETLRQLIRYGTIPIITENDTVSAAEIKFGDNDTLSALVASLTGAQHLVILSTAPGLVDLRGTKAIVPVVERITPEIEAMAGGTTSETATGGMISKIAAAKLATKSGCGVFIASGAEPEILARLLAGRGPGTFFVPSGLPLEAKKHWLAYFQRPHRHAFRQRLRGPRPARAGPQPPRGRRHGRPGRVRRRRHRKPRRTRRHRLRARQVRLWQRRDPRPRRAAGRRRRRALPRPQAPRGHPPERPRAAVTGAGTAPGLKVDG